MKIHPLFLSRKKDNNSASFSLHFIEHQLSLFPRTSLMWSRRLLVGWGWGDRGCWEKVWGTKGPRPRLPSSLPQSTQLSKMINVPSRELEYVTTQNLKSFCFSCKVNDNHSNNNNHGTSRDIQIRSHLILTTPWMANRANVIASFLWLMKLRLKEGKVTPSVISWY